VTLIKKGWGGPRSGGWKERSTRAGGWLDMEVKWERVPGTNLTELENERRKGSTFLEMLFRRALENTVLGESGPAKKRKGHNRPRLFGFWD